MINMSKKLALIVLAVVVVIGSLFTYYGSNFLFSDVANMVPGIKDANIITTFPMFMVACEFMLGAIYLVRYIRRSQYVKSMTKKYLIIFMCFSFVGFVTSILSGTMIYHSFVKSAPFIAYPLVMAIVHAILIGVAIYFYIYVSKNMKEDETKRKFSIVYVLYNIANSLFVYFVMERFGAFLMFPFWIQWRTIYLTWPFIISLIVPVAMVIQTLLYSFDSYKKKPLFGLVFAIANFVIGLATNIAARTIGYYDSRAISAISPAMAIERLDCSTIITKITFAIIIIVGGITIAHAAVHYIKCKKIEKSAQVAEEK